MIRRRVVRLLAVAVTLAGASAVAPAQDSPAFPHEKHARVFPVCEGCHAGIVSGDTSADFPRIADCERCHDGTRVRKVAWRQPAPRASNLRFSHTEHRRSVDAAHDSAPCLTCHAASDPPRRMVVAGPDPQRCVQCHANDSGTHIAPTAACRTCHVPVAQAPRLTGRRIAAFPEPAWHQAADFRASHGAVGATQAASCAICHARESCERCHANADRVPLIAALARDTRIASLQRGRAAAYDTPASHRLAAWRTTHGAGSTSFVSCANCHTQPSCETCHVESGGTSRTAILTLPAPNARGGPGVAPSRIDRRVHPANIISRHGTLAASGAMDCRQCHTERTCSGCHAAPDSRRFHPDDFVQRHAVEVFTAGADCQSCHNTERFCRECHSRVGVAAQARMSAAFHTGKANWVLSHGQAARMGMEACAACHRQQDCVRCHSANGGWGVNPHGAGFQADRRAALNSASCRWCHYGALPGGGP